MLTTALTESSRIDRRGFLAAGLGCLGAALTVEGAAPPDAPLLDIHVHLFGVGEGGTGCRMEKSITDTWLFRGLVFALGLRKKGKKLDEEYERVLTEHVKQSGLHAAILGQDAVYDRRGKAD